MKKYTLICIGLCAAMAFTSCKSSESAYKKAYEKAKQYDTQTAQQAAPAAQEAVVAPVEAKPVDQAQVVDNLDNISVRQESVQVIHGNGLNAFSVVVGSFGLLSNAESLYQRLKDAGYDVTRLDNVRKLVLITGHRRENFGDGFISICSAIKTLNLKYPDVDFVYPMHLNPNVRKPIQKVFENKTPENMFFIEPLDYLPFVFLMEKSYLVLTDSGGIQEEAPGLGKPVLVMRNTTERPEAVDAGTVKLVGTDFNTIISEVSKLIDDPDHYRAMSHAVNPYGDGKACPRIVRALLSMNN